MMAQRFVLEPEHQTSASFAPRNQTVPRRIRTTTLFCVSPTVNDVLRRDSRSPLGASVDDAGGACPEVGGGAGWMTEHDTLTGVAHDLLGVRIDRIIDVVCFLASDKAAYVTGQVIRVDGGMTNL